MVVLSSTDKDVRLVGEGGNSWVYILEREYNGMRSAAIKVPKAFVECRVTEALENYHILKNLGIKTTVFLEECLFDGQRALITENLHKEEYVYLDANAHLQTEADRMLMKLNPRNSEMYSAKEPDEERMFADNKFERITNFPAFVKEHLALLKRISEAHIFLAYDCYFFKVERKKVTDIDYIIADWDDILRYYEDDLFEKNKEEFISSLWQFVYKYVDEMSAGKYFCFLKEIKQLA